MTAAPDPFDLAFAEVKATGRLAAVLELEPNLDPRTREFLLSVKLNRGPTPDPGKPLRDLHLARAKVFYDELRKAGVPPHKAFKAMWIKFQLTEETARAVVNGNYPEVRRLVQEIQEQDSSVAAHPRILDALDE